MLFTRVRVRECRRPSNPEDRQEIGDACKPNKEAIEGLCLELLRNDLGVDLKRLFNPDYAIELGDVGTVSLCQGVHRIHPTERCLFSDRSDFGERHSWQQVPNIATKRPHNPGLM